MNQENTNPPAAEVSVTPESAPPSTESTQSPAAISAVPAEELIDIEYFSKVKLRVALVESVEAVPKSKKLLKLQVNLGEQLGTRQVLSGISQFYTPESLVGKRVIIVSNLKPAKLMGLDSQGMLLAGSDDATTVLAVIEPNEQLPLGSIVR